jgi:Flp pilus assembly protein TadB
MFDDIKDTFAKITVARLQKRIDALKAQQEMLDKFTTQRTLSELEHYRLQLSIGVASFVFFGMLCLVGMSIAVAATIAHHPLTATETLFTALCVLMIFLILTGIWESNCLKTIKYWRAASPINRAAAAPD